MLQIKNVCKTYKTKGSQSVKALDNVSLSIEEKGMVFILGKSGSGKSTLLNVLGGLDKADSGDIVICGKSSADFTQSDFDSYRNTFIGFIFQEYNILNEFTVGANIALAMELQGKKATKKSLNDMLDRVDLQGLGNRRPNTLSGGQKQRVAIARALIKEPQIIMADEPTGALDSNTGKQVFDTLKKLSSEKLVLVVSHDREFAEQYADRIIELADGKIVSDVCKHTKPSSRKSQGISVVDDRIIHIKKGYSLTSEDLRLIYEYLSNNAQNDSIISLDGKTNNDIRKSARILDNGEREVFENTTDSDVEKKQYDASRFKLIRSKLPFANSFKIGASGLKTKPFRLFMTILLSTIAFTLFGLASTMSTYNKTETTISSFVDSGIDYVSLSKTAFINSNNYQYRRDTSLTTTDIEKLKKETGLNFYPVLGSDSDGRTITLGNLADGQKLSSGAYFNVYDGYIGGIITGNESIIKENGFTLDGRLPSAGNEIAVTEHIYTQYKIAGYNYNGEKTEIKSHKDLIGRTITLRIGNDDSDYTVVGIVDTDFKTDRYKKFLPKTEDKNQKPVEETITETVVEYVLGNELRTLQQYSYHTLCFVSNEKFQEAVKSKTKYVKSYGDNYSVGISNGNQFMSSAFYAPFSMADTGSTVFFENGKTTLEDGEILVSLQVAQLIKDENNYEDLASLSGKVIGHNASSFIDNDKNYDLNMVIVGYYTSESDITVLPDSVYNTLKSYAGEGVFQNAVAHMPEDSKGIRDIVKYCYTSSNGEEDGYKFRNTVNVVLDEVSSFIETASKAFVIIGVIFAVFSALMLTNFIATSISYKKREIGILRAVGARGKDVFGIFFNESMLIALINWLSSTAFTIILVGTLNHYLRTSYGLLITILNFGIIQLVTMIAISIGVAFIASFMPVYKTSRKKPIDAIRS